MLDLGKLRLKSCPIYDCFRCANMYLGSGKKWIQTQVIKWRLWDIICLDLLHVLFGAGPQI